MSKRQHGHGGVYQPKYRDSSRALRTCRTFSIAYWVNGRHIRESTHSADRAVAEKLLEQRIRERDRKLAQRQSRRVARKWFDELDELPLAEILAHSVQTLLAELRRLQNPVPGVYFLRSREFIKVGYASDFETRLTELQCAESGCSISPPRPACAP